MTTRKKTNDDPDPMTDTGKIRRDAIIKNSANRFYLLTIVAMTLTAFGLIMGIVYLRPESDILLVLGAVSAIIAPTTLSLLALMKSQETHLSVNSRLDSFIKSELKASKDAAILEGMKLADARTDDLQQKRDDAKKPAPTGDVVPVKIVETSSVLPVEIVKGNEEKKEK